MKKAKFVVRTREPRNASVAYNRKWLDGDRYYQRGRGPTFYWTPTPQDAALYDSEEAARECPAYGWNCEIVPFEVADAEAFRRSEL